MARVHILGAGTPTPTADRYGSAYVVDTGNELVMFDCGPAATHKFVQAGLWPTDVNTLFFTHHHYDHDVDYPCFLLCRWDQSIGKEETLQVFGPDHTTELTEKLIGEDGAFAPDWRARVGHPGSQQVYVNRGGTLPRPAPHVDAVNIEPGWVRETDDWKVTSAWAEHAQPFLDSLAYRIDTPDTSIVITGDTAPCDSVRELAEGADVMLSMCWDHQEAMECAGEHGGQTGTVSAGQLADDAGVRNLVLVHMGPGLSKPGSMERAVGDIREVYKGAVWFSHEVSSLDFGPTIGKSD